MFVKFWLSAIFNLTKYFIWPLKMPPNIRLKYKLDCFTRGRIIDNVLPAVKRLYASTAWKLVTADQWHFPGRKGSCIESIHGGWIGMSTLFLNDQVGGICWKEKLLLFGGNERLAELCKDYVFKYLDLIWIEIIVSRGCKQEGTQPSRGRFILYGTSTSRNFKLLPNYSSILWNLSSPEVFVPDPFELCECLMNISFIKHICKIRILKKQLKRNFLRTFAELSQAHHKFFLTTNWFSNYIIFLLNFRQNPWNCVWDFPNYYYY